MTLPGGCQLKQYTATSVGEFYSYAFITSFGRTKTRGEEGAYFVVENSIQQGRDVRKMLLVDGVTTGRHIAADALSIDNLVSLFKSIQTSEMHTVGSDLVVSCSLQFQMPYFNDIA